MKLRSLPTAILMSSLILNISIPQLGHAEETIVTASSLETAVQKGLPYLEERGNWWIEKKECMSCHRVAFTAWSHVEAAKAGAPVAPEKVNHWIDWCLQNLFEPFPEKDQKYPGEKTIERNLSGAAQILALSKNWNSSQSQKKYQTKIIDYLVKGQMKDGKWNPKGQLPGQKRELLETSHVITLWNSLALLNIRQQPHVPRETVSKTIAAAKGFVSQYDAGKSSEWIALRALFATELGDQNEAEKYLEKLKAAQNPDGGWGWIAGEESDVLATAQVIYALVEMDAKLDSANIKKGVAFLLKSQTEQGSWKVKGTKEKAKTRFTETANYWGSAWAVIALSKVRAAMP